MRTDYARTVGIRKNVTVQEVESAVASNDMQTLIAVIERMQWQHQYNTLPQLVDYACRSARFLLNIRYGTIRNPKLAAIYKTPKQGHTHR